LAFVAAVQNGLDLILEVAKSTVVEMKQTVCLDTFLTMLMTQRNRQELEAEEKRMEREVEELLQSAEKMRLNNEECGPEKQQEELGVVVFFSVSALLLRVPT
jgi:hypothetical protein